MVKLEHVYLNQPKNPYQTELVPPFRFATVELGLYRSAYPKERNFDFLRRLGLKCIISLTPASSALPESLGGKISSWEYHSSLDKFCSESGIKRIHLPVEKPKDHIPLTPLIITQCLQLLLNVSESHPVLIHCLDGANVTGMIVMCLRKLQLWDRRITISEFCRFTRDNVINQDETDFFDKYSGTFVASGPLSSSTAASNSASAQPAGDNAESQGKTTGSLNVTVNVQLSSYGVSRMFGAQGMLADELFVTLKQPNPQQELELPSSSVPLWLWNGQLPAGFLKSVTNVPSQQSSSHTDKTTCSNPSSAVSTPTSALPSPFAHMLVTYGHPRIRLRLSTYHLKTLLLNSASVSLTSPIEAAKLMLTQPSAAPSSSRTQSRQSRRPDSGGAAGFTVAANESKEQLENLGSLEILAESQPEYYDDYSLTLKALDLDGV